MEVCKVDIDLDEELFADYCAYEAVESESRKGNEVRMWRTPISK